ERLPVLSQPPPASGEGSAGEPLGPHNVWVPGVQGEDRRELLVASRPLDMDPWRHRSHLRLDGLTVRRARGRFGVARHRLRGTSEAEGRAVPERLLPGCQTLLLGSTDGQGEAVVRLLLL